jgi:hypothetical protein
VFRWTEGWTKDKEWINNVLPLSRGEKNIETDVSQVQLKKPYYEPYFKATAPLLVQSESKLPMTLRRETFFFHFNENAAKLEYFTPLDETSMLKVDLLSFPPKV